VVVDGLVSRRQANDILALRLTFLNIRVSQWVIVTGAAHSVIILIITARLQQQAGFVVSLMLITGLFPAVSHTNLSDRVSPGV